MSVGYIYKTTNLLNNKIYIGKKLGVFDPRYFGSGLYLQRALKAYGEETFKVESILRAPTEWQLNEAERFVISKLRKAIGRDNMYNISDGGDGFTGKHTEEFKQKLRKPRSRTAVQKGVETRKRLTKERGYYFSEETLTKVRTPTENRYCECKCDEMFNCKITSPQRFIKGHENRGRVRSEEFKQNLRNKKPSKESIEKGLKTRWGKTDGLN